MRENDISKEIVKLKRLVLILFLITLALGSYILMQFINDKPTLSNNNNSESIDYKVIIEQLDRKLDELTLELESTKETFEKSIKNNQDNINLLREPNVLFPFHTYSGHAGIIYNSPDGEGRWIPNSLGYELSLLIDQAIRNGKGKNIEYAVHSNYFIVNYHLDEMGPSLDIIFDLEENIVYIDSQQYAVNEADLETILSFLETNSIDGNSR
jgi:hypothetical protein